MPIYNYECGSCGGFDALAKLSESGQPASCPQCGEEAPRMMSAPRISTAPESGTGRMRYNGAAHPTGCGCCGPTPMRSNAVPKATSFLAEG